MRTKRAGVLVAIVALTTTGCGGDGADVQPSDDASTTTTAPPADDGPGGMYGAPETTASTPGGGGRTTTIAPSGGSRPGTASTASPTTRPATTRPPTQSPPQTNPQSTTTVATTTTTAGGGGGGAAITIQNFSFNPAVLNVSVGTRVTATNRDSAPHTWSADNGTWDSGTLAKDASFSYTFTQAGTFGYLCKIHPSMRGTVQVT